ncbi:MAG: DUF2062 domain-containing protein [Steroidobacteraceae bacterium]
MPRHLIRKWTPSPEQIRSHWYLRPFGTRIADPALWSVTRRGVTAAFGAGLAICFVPLPVHLVLAAIVAVVARINAPVLVATVLLVNPLTFVPVYYSAYRVGAALLGHVPQPFRFELSWAWLQYGLGPLWKPFLVGCLVCSVVAGVLGWALLEWFWRHHVRKRYRTRATSATR